MGLPGPPASLLEMVPEPMMEPAVSRRVLAAWAISCGNENVMSTPALGRPSNLPLTEARSGRCTLPPDQAGPSSSGVTATGEKAVDGLPWKKPKPLPSSAGMRFLSETSLASMTRRMRSAASLALAPIGTSPVTTATSPSRSMPQAASAIAIGSCGPRKLSDPPWYINGSVQQLDVADIGRAIGPLVGARQRCHAALGGKFAAVEARRSLAGGGLVELGRDPLDLQDQVVPIVQQLLQGFEPGDHRRGRHHPGEVARDDDEAPIPGAIAIGGDLHARLRTGEAASGRRADDGRPALFIARR